MAEVAVRDAVPGGSMGRERLDFERLWEEAIPYDRFVAEAEHLRGVWEGVYKKAVLPSWAVAQAEARYGGVRLLVLTEDWCWDAANELPVLAKLGAETGCLPIRVLRRDDYPEVMDRYLTNGARAIPVVVTLAADGTELGHWGSRPRELQAWVQAHKAELSKQEFCAAMRRWHVEDKGESTLREVLALVP